MKNKYILYMTDNMYGNARNNKGKLEFNKKVKPGKCIIPFKYKWRYMCDNSKQTWYIKNIWLLL